MPTLDSAPRRNAGLALDIDATRLVLRARDRVPRILLDIPRLTVPAQAHAAFVGEPGSGKTTLAGTLAALNRPERGTLMWGALNVAAMDRRAAARWRRETVGWAAGAPARTAGSATQRLLHAADVARRSMFAFGGGMRDLLDDAGVARKRPAVRSAADERLVILAHALRHAPSIVIADEPTIALSHADARRVEDVLRGWCAAIGATLVVTTHDRALASRFDRGYALGDRTVTAMRGPERVDADATRV